MVGCTYGDAVRNDTLTAPERPRRPAAPVAAPPPVAYAPVWWRQRAPHDRPELPAGGARWRPAVVGGLPGSRRRRRGLVLLRPLAAAPVLMLLLLVRLAVLVGLPIAWGCRVVANDLPAPLERAYRFALRLVN